MEPDDWIGDPWDVLVDEAKLLARQVKKLVVMIDHLLDDYEHLLNVESAVTYGQIRSVGVMLYHDDVHHLVNMADTLDWLRKQVKEAVDD